MRIPGFTRKKSLRSGLNDTQTASYLQPGSNGGDTSLSRTRSGASSAGLGEFGQRNSIDQPQQPKRSFFKRAHSRSLSTDAQGKLDSVGSSNVSSRPIPATVSGGHPLRQQTLPQDIDGSKSKRPMLFVKRAASTLGGGPYVSSGPVHSSRGSLPLNDTISGNLTAPAASPLDSGFQLKSFRSVSGVKEDKPTLSSLVDADFVSSPSSTRPNSPSLAGQGGSYFDSLPGGRSSDSPSVNPHERTYSSGSISVAKFREAKAARSSSSLASSERLPHATGLKLDLPPPITMDYHRPYLSSLQPAPSTPPESVSCPAHRSSPTAQSDAQELVVPQFDSPHSAPLISTLASHPDNALPLPPLPAEPRRSFHGHSRRTSTQSITSISSAFGGWLNSTTSNFGIAFSVEDVQKAINSGAVAALRSVSPSQEHAPIFADATSHASRDKEDEQEVIDPAVAKVPSKEELDLLLGGKILPPPPSETNDLAPRSLSTSPTPVLSRTSSLTNLSSGFSQAKHLFSNSVARIAKASQMADDTSSESSVDLQAPKVAKAPHPSPAKKKRIFGDSSSDEESLADSDDSDVEKRRAERARVFPPPRPMTQQQREHVYRSAQASPYVSPHGSAIDLRSSSIVGKMSSPCSQNLTPSLCCTALDSACSPHSGFDDQRIVCTQRRRRGEHPFVGNCKPSIGRYERARCGHAA